MNGLKLFKKFMMPCGLCAAVPVIKSKAEATEVSNDNTNKQLVRPSELPIYTFEKPKSREPSCKENLEPNVLEQGFGTVRKSVQDFLKQFSSYTDSVSNTIDVGYAHSKESLEFLREETNVVPRIGAISIGGLSGFIFGIRGGKFKRFVYTSTGALVVASICYPKQAQESLTIAKYYINVGYNFLYGVKPGEANQLEISWPELPKIPSSFSDVTNIVNNAAGSAASVAGTLFNKALNSFNEFSETPKPPGELKETKESKEKK